MKNSKRKALLGVLVIVVLVLCIGLFTKNKTNTLNNTSINKETTSKELDENLIGAYIQTEGDEYTPTSEIPTSGYEFNSEKSYCKIGDAIQEDMTLFYDMDTQTLTVSPIVEEGTKCYLYFDEKASGGDYILAQEGGEEAIEAKGTPDFSKIATTDEGMYAAEDDYGISYYYRGAVQDNWFQFGTNSSGQSLYWRIIRINGDGSIRIIYNGVSMSQAGDSTMIYTGQAFNSSQNDNMSVGYMYESGQVHGLRTDSHIKITIDNWYTSNLADEAEYLDGNTGFCGDRTIYSGTGIGTTFTYYAVYNRLVRNNNPNFKCSDTKDLYTTINSNAGNKSLSNPIGLITADEIAFAGDVYGSSNSSYYLYNNAYYWTMSPYWYNDYAGVFLVDEYGRLGSSGVNITYGVRPVINLRADVALTGSGTTADPFKVVGA